MDRDTLLTAFDAQLRRRVPDVLPPGQSYERLGPVLRVVGQHRGFIEGGSRLGVEGAELDRLIARHRDFFAARGEGVEWKTYGYDETPNLPAHLLAAGFVREDKETVVIGAAEDMTLEPELPAAIGIRQVSERSDFERIAVMKSQVWGTDLSWLAAHLEAQVRAAPDDLVVLVAEVGGQVVSAAWLEFNPGTDFAGLWGGSTLAAWRRRGIYRALVARRAQLAVARGVRYLQVDATDNSRPILLKLGFLEVTTTTPYVWTPTSGAGSTVSRVVTAHY